MAKKWQQLRDEFYRKHPGMKERVDALVEKWSKEIGRMEMRSPDRIERIMNKLQLLWFMHPDLRLGQLVLNLTPWDKHPRDPFYVEDDEWEVSLDEQLTKEKLWQTRIESSESESSV